MLPLHAADSKSGRHDSNVRPLRPERSALARLSYAPMGATSEVHEIKNIEFRTWERVADYPPGPRRTTPLPDRP